VTKNFAEMEDSRRTHGGLIYVYIYMIFINIYIYMFIYICLYLLDYIFILGCFLWSFSVFLVTTIFFSPFEVESD
jgi:uncharacterized membrane protein